MYDSCFVLCIPAPACLPWHLLQHCSAYALPVQELLQKCGRSHNLSDVYSAIDAVHQAAMPSWSLDLISGLPGLTTAMWQQSLEAAIKAQPDHLSVYDLQVLMFGCIVLLVCHVCMCLSRCKPMIIRATLEIVV